MSGRYRRITRDDYSPMKKGQKYIVFLLSDTKDHYLLMNHDLGRLAYGVEKHEHVTVNKAEQELAHTFLQDAMKKYNLGR